MPPFASAPKLRRNCLLVDATVATVDARRAVNRKSAAWKTGRQCDSFYSDRNGRLILLVAAGEICRPASGDRLCFGRRPGLFCAGDAARERPLPTDRRWPSYGC
jgi:hypothetical protein